MVKQRNGRGFSQADTGGSRQGPPIPTLPKGGGAIRGIGEKFAANPVTGTGSMSVPIATSPGRSGFGPQLKLSYDSGAGNGPFGFGWSLSQPAVTRKTDKGLPRYDDGAESDVFLLSGAEDLVPVAQPDDATAAPGYRIRRYRPRIEGLFARIERWTRLDDPADVHWRSISRDNVLTLYGNDANARITDPSDPARIFSWLICETRDDKGNAVLYRYKAEDGLNVDLARAHERNRGAADDARRRANRYVKRILYGNRATLLDREGRRLPFLAEEQVQGAKWMFEVVFDYGEHDPVVPTPTDDRGWPARNDPFSAYRAGYEVRTNRLCRRILMFHHFPDEPEVREDCLVRSTDFTYSRDQVPDVARDPNYSFLISVAHTGYRRSDGGYTSRGLPPLTFEYTLPVVQDVVEEVDAASLENLPVGLNGGCQWADLHGEGLHGILAEQGGAWFYKRNLSPINVREQGGAARVEARFGPIERVAARPNLTLDGDARFMDLAGDGRPDLVLLDGPLPGLYEHDEAESWGPFERFTERLTRAFDDPNLRFVDLDGDGHADVLITEDDAFVWHPSRAEEGFGPAHRVAQASDEEKGPRLVFADGEQAVYLADLSGDGLPDLARVRNGEVCYWPNLGYGRFGAKVTMDDAPWFDKPDQFEQDRVRLADIDGTGTTDIIYLHGDGVRLYFNQSGNSWTAAQTLHVFPKVDNLSDVNTADILGNGTACLVWSSSLPGDAGRPLRYVNLMGDEKPHLLVRTVNNLGAETRIRYAPSTRFYLQDKSDGQPWITRLPFPVHVVERVEAFDHVSRNRFVTRYAYHHGYFDGEEREFRGFGMVEQFDTEASTALSGGGTPPAATNLDAASHVPPVCTRTWFHTGIYFGHDRVSRFFAGVQDAQDRGEYYREPAWRNDDEEAKKRLLPDTVLPDGLTPEEEREAARALKGMMLRQEVYALDGVGRDADHPYGHPYTVTEQSFAVRLLQSRGERRHAIFFTHPSEALIYHYEREPADPRIEHALTLEVDEFGNALKTAAVGYGRRAASTDLPTDADRAKQTASLLIYTENAVTNPILSPFDHRTPLPAEAVTYELTGYTPTGANGRFRREDLVAPDPAGPTRLVHIHDGEVAYETSPPAGRQRRLIENVRSLYRKDDLTALLPLGGLEPLALPGEDYTLAFTSGLLTHIYKRKAGPEPEESLLPEAEQPQVLGGRGGDQGGYLDLNANGHWWIPSGRCFFSTTPDDADPAATAAAELADARQHFFLPRKFTGPFGHSSTVDYDTPHDLLVIRTEDAVQNTVTATHDYRVLQPALVTDPNGNRSEVRFDALGLVVGTAVAGKNGEGDSFAAFTADLLPEQIRHYLDSDDPRPLAVEHLGTATTRILYDLERVPACVASVARETHESELDPNEQTRVQLSFIYSDGFGREAQTVIQAEPGPLDPNDPGSPRSDPRWVGTGTTIFNNKGKPVRQFEPFFTSSHHFGIERRGASSTLFYDPLERVIASLHPNHTWEKVTFDPWQKSTHDVNDTVLIADPGSDADVGDFFRRLPDDEYLPTWHALRTDPSLALERWPDADPLSGTPLPRNATIRAAERQAAEKTSLHADTPSVIHFDVLGRPFLTVTHNRFFDGSNTIDETHETRTELDVEGNVRAVTDHLGRAVARFDHNLLGSVIHTARMDSGERWMLGDVAGNSIRAWDNRGHAFRTAYDALRRPSQAFVTGTDPQSPEAEALLRVTIYGESVPDAGQALNLRGRVLMQSDAAGAVVNAAANPDTGAIEAFDFKGNLLRSTLRLAREYKRVANWHDADSSAVQAALAASPFTPDNVLVALAPLLETQAFTASTTFDALNRPRSLTTPDASEILPAYNEANLLERMTVRLRDTTTTTPFVNDIAYDAKGQRARIEYGNGVVTEYEYDDDTFRLTRARTTRQTGVNPLQDLRYTYDPAGNITGIRDDAQQTIYFANAVVEPHADYAYDALYRLIRVEGREHIGQTFNTLPDHHPEKKPHYDFNDSTRRNPPHSNDGQAMRRYIERYAYDAVGNIRAMIHQASGGTWTRHYTYAVDSNHLLSTNLPGDPEEGPYSAKYEYDAHGSVTRMPHLPLMAWDYRDQLQATSQQVITNGGTPETTYYVYDTGGQRVRKVTERQAAPGQMPVRMKERIYFGGFEVYREYQNDGETVALERETLHIVGDKRRVALVETRTDVSGASTPQLIRYQFDNHLGSAVLELDDAGQIISYEEYYPYGSTSYQSGRSAAEVSQKRYRYTGTERDEENGLNYHGARYYASWLGRWVSCDPAGIADGVNVYRYVQNNPIAFIDLHGFNTTVTVATGEVAGPGDNVWRAGDEWLHIDPAGNTWLYQEIKGWEWHEEWKPSGGGEFVRVGRYREAVVAHQWTMILMAQAVQIEDSAPGGGGGVLSTILTVADVAVSVLSPSNKVRLAIRGAQFAANAWENGLVEAGEDLAYDIAQDVGFDMAGKVVGAVRKRNAGGGGSGGGGRGSGGRGSGGRGSGGRGSGGGGSGGGGSGGGGSGGGGGGPSRRRSNQARLTGARSKARKDALDEVVEAARSGHGSERALHTIKRLEAKHGREAVVHLQDHGRFPPDVTDMEFSHLFPASKYPELAHKYELGVITDKQEHRLGHHGGDTRKDLNGAPLDPDWEDDWGWQFFRSEE